MPRPLLGALLGLSLALTGFIAAGLVAAPLLADDTGFAGSATVAVWAVGGAVAGLACAIVLARQLSAPVLARVTWLAVAVAIAATWWMQRQATAQRLARENRPVALGAATHGAAWFPSRDC